MRKTIQNLPIRFAREFIGFIMLLIVVGLQLSASGQGTSFTYQGRLNDGASPANGLYDLQFGVYDAVSNGNQQGNLITNSATEVSNGLFTVTLDFGNQFPGAARWLEISARTNGAAAFVTLAPRQAFTSTPYSIQSASAASAGSVAAGNVTGTLAAGQLPAGIVTNGAKGVTVSGTFTGSGIGLTNVALLSGGNTFTGNQIINNGHVGIGTNTPGLNNVEINPIFFSANGYGLVVARSDFGENIQINRTNGAGGIGLVVDNATTGDSSTSMLMVRNNVATAPQVLFDILANGNVGIGTSTPATSLDVNGTVHATFSGNGVGVTNVPISNVNSGSAIAWPGNFTLTSSPGVGNLPQSIIAADVNGDGKMDLICADAGNNILSVLTNNGSGGFAQATNLPVGASPVSVVAADINGDGKVDLVCANAGDDTLSVLTNNGNGGFVLAFTLSTDPPETLGSEPQVVVAADVNGDGKVDLIGVNLVGTLAVLTNNGSGGFAPASFPDFSGVDPNPALVSAVAADFNGDGKIDLACLDFNNGRILVATNNGGSGFVLASMLSMPAGSTPSSVTTADVNGDGKMDLISANQGSNTLSVFTNNGSGGFALASSLSTGGDSLPVSVTAADVNGDGKVDLISANSGDDTLSVFTNDGSGGFVLASSSAIGAAPDSVTAADVNGDGKPDLISADFYSGTLSVLFNTPVFNGNFNGSFDGDGSGLTGIPALNGGNIFTGDQIITNGTLYDYGGVVVRPANPGWAAATEYDGTNNTTGFRAFVGADGIGITGAAGQMYVGTLTANPVTFYTSDQPRIVIATNGNVGIGTFTPTNKLHVIGGVSATAFVTTSDRNAKENFAPVSPLEVLDKVTALPIQTWNFKDMKDGRHMGPMAQDFYAAFHLGSSDTTITTVDPDGVALAAIQGLNQKVEGGNEKIQQLEDENAELKARLEKLEQLINSRIGNSNEK